MCKTKTYTKKWNFSMKNQEIKSKWIYIGSADKWREKNHISFFTKNLFS